MPTYPQDTNDTVLYTGEDIFVPKDSSVTVLADSRMFLFGDWYLNGSPISTGELEAIYPSGDTSGVTDVDAINRALVTKPNVLLGPGTFYVNNAIIIPASNKRLSGSGKYLTTIFQVSGSNIYAQAGIVGYGPGGLSNITVCDLTIDGNKAGNTVGTGIMFPLFTNSSVERCCIKNAPDKGVHVYLGSNFSLLDCDLLNIGIGTTPMPNGTYAAFISQSTTKVRVIGNYVNGCGDTGLLVNGGDGFGLIVGNHVENCHGIGIGLGSGHSPVGGPFNITGNTVKGTVNSTGIDTGTAYNVSVSGNTIMNAGADGICHDASGVAGGVANVVFSNNSILNSGTGGINVICNQTTGHTGFSIVGNTINVCNSFGIRLDSASKSTVIGNTIRYPGNDCGGVELYCSTPVTECVVQGNIVQDRPAGSNWSHGIRVVGNGADWHSVTGNIVRGTGAPMTGNFGANSIVKDNLGV